MNLVNPAGGIPTLVFGQNDAPVQPPLGGAGGGMTTATGDPAGAPGADAAAPPSGFLGGNMMIFIFLILFVFIGMSFLSQRKEKKRRKNMLASLDTSASVQTIGGIIGSVVEVKEDTVVLKVDDLSNTRMTFSRAAIQQVLESGKGAASN
jgi:preprotein translocase subunit YajC